MASIERRSPKKQIPKPRSKHASIEIRLANWSDVMGDCDKIRQDPSGVGFLPRTDSQTDIGRSGEESAMSSVDDVRKLIDHLELCARTGAGARLTPNSVELLLAASRSHIDVAERSTTSTSRYPFQDGEPWSPTGPIGRDTGHCLRCIDRRGDVRWSGGTAPRSQNQIAIWRQHPVGSAENPRFRRLARHLHLVKRNTCDVEIQRSRKPLPGARNVVLPRNLS